MCCHHSNPHQPGLPGHPGTNRGLLRMAHSWHSINAGWIALNLCSLNQQHYHLGQTDVVQVSWGPDVPKGGQLPRGQSSQEGGRPTSRAAFAGLGKHLSASRALPQAPWRNPIPASPPSPKPLGETPPPAPSPVCAHSHRELIPLLQEAEASLLQAVSEAATL